MLINNIFLFLMSLIVLIVVSLCRQDELSDLTAESKGMLETLASTSLSSNTTPQLPDDEVRGGSWTLYILNILNIMYENNNTYG